MTDRPNNNATGAPSPTRIMDLASAFYGSCVLFAANDMGVFAAIAARGPSPLDHIAEACKLSERGARLLLDACTALGLLVKSGDGRYANAPEAALFLVPGSPGDLSGALRYNRDVYAAWGRLADMVRTGLPVERPEVHLGDDPARTRAFVLAMHSRALAIGRAVVPQIDARGATRLLDLGGGPGTYAVLLAQANPRLVCTTLDLPAVSDVARELVQRAGLSDRVQCVAGDYRVDAFPPDQDVATLFGVLHQESPESVVDILRRTLAALRPGGRVYVLDMMTDASRTQPVFSALFGVNMALTARNGWVFSDADLRDWMTQAGFTDFACRGLPPPLPHWLASARRP